MFPALSKASENDKQLLIEKLQLVMVLITAQFLITLGRIGKIRITENVNAEFPEN